MKSIKNNITNLYEIEKSKFYCLLIKINSLKEVDTILEQAKKDYKDATHYCYAYILDSYKKCSDDGEPQGTAGVPMLDAIKKANINNIVAVVTRYFGGIKLGAGGLIRAYTNAVSQALNVSKLLKIKEYSHYEIEFNYSLINVIEKYFNQNNIKVLDKEYEIKVKYLFYVDDQNIKEKLFNLTLGKIEFTNEYLDFIEEKIN
jgi:uncharacterized YigZ family protein